jgi:hypothetical protein
MFLYNYFSIIVQFSGLLFEREFETPDGLNFGYVHENIAFLFSIW